MNNFVYSYIFLTVATIMDYKRVSSLREQRAAKIFMDILHGSCSIKKKRNKDHVMTEMQEIIPLITLAVLFLRFADMFSILAANSAHTRPLT